jgi:hypothetical protein
MFRAQQLVRPLRQQASTRLVLGLRAASTIKHTAHLNAVNEQDVAHFAKILPKSAILSTLGSSGVSDSELSSYNNDWMGKYRGNTRVVLRPKTTQQVSEILKYCNERSIGVVPQGGNTGLVGGSVPINDEVVINLGSMSNIRSFDNVSGVLDNFPYI